MANNRMFLICRKCSKKENGAIQLAKFYPSGGWIAGKGPGWYVANEELEDKLNEFFALHEHKFDKSMFGGWQYDIAYEITGDNTNEKEQILNVISGLSKKKGKRK